MTGIFDPVGENEGQKACSVTSDLKCISICKKKKNGLGIAPPPAGGALDGHLAHLCLKKTIWFLLPPRTRYK